MQITETIGGDPALIMTFLQKIDSLDEIERRTILRIIKKIYFPLEKDNIEKGNTKDQWLDLDKK